LDSEPGPNVAGVAANLSVKTANVCDAERIQELVLEIRPDRLVHLAAQAFVPDSVRDPTLTLRTNILGTASILEAARKLGQNRGNPPAVLLISSAEVYGRVPPEGQPISEESPLRPHNPYAASKASAELIAGAYRNTYGMDIIVARPFNHAGSRQNPSFVCSEFACRFAEIASGASKPELHVGNLDARRDFTDVRDVVRAYWALFDRRSEEAVFNVCSGRAYRIGEVISLLEEIAGFNVEVISETEKTRSYDTLLFVGSNERLHRATGWSPSIAFRDTLRDVFSYWQARTTQRA
jgi:GDP-4-dehydro-6-deoxy-D-mannose reductase